MEISVWRPGVVKKETAMNKFVGLDPEPPDNQLYSREIYKKIAGIEKNVEIDEELKTRIYKRVYQTKWLKFCRTVLDFSDEEIDNVKKNDISSEDLYELMKKLFSTNHQKFKALFLKYKIELPESGSEAKAIYKLIESIPLTKRYYFATLIKEGFVPTTFHFKITREVMKYMLECWCERVNPTYDYLQNVIDVAEKMKFLEPTRNAIPAKRQKLMNDTEVKEKSEGEGFLMPKENATLDTLQKLMNVAEEEVFPKPETFKDAESRFGSKPDTASKNTEDNDKSPHPADDKEVNQQQSQIYIVKNKTEMKASEKTSVTSIVDCEYEETMDRVKEFIEKMKSKQLGELEELEFCLCHLKKKHLEEFLSNEVLKAVVCKISKLSIGFTENVTDLIPFYCQIASNYKSTNLSLEFNDLKNEDIEALAKNLNKNDKYMELDISYNKNIKPDGYETVGKIVRKHDVKKLKLADCNISDEDLEYLFKGMGNAKLEVLDISCTDNVTTEGFEHIGKQVAQKRIKRLKLSDTQLNVDTLTAFYKKSIEYSEDHQVLVEEIDVSYNSTMEPKAYKDLGSMVKLFGVKTLNLAGCGLGEDHLKNLREEMNPENSTEKNEHYTKMESLNARDNKAIGIGIFELAKIVKECELKELDISECRMSANELENFIDALENANLKCLYLGEERQFDKNYIDQVCNLLPHIKEMLCLKGTVRTHLRSLLQEKLNTLEDNELEIKLDDDMTLCSQKTNNATI